MAAKDLSGARERAFHRVSYPPGYPEHLLPRVVLEPHTPATFEDWSETGLRIQLPALSALALNDVVRLTITPHASHAIAVEGTIVRVEGSWVSVRLKRPSLPRTLMLNEQRAILAWQATTPETAEEVEAKRRNSRHTIDELS
jgi:hypothetical protein